MAFHSARVKSRRRSSVGMRGHTRLHDGTDGRDRRDRTAAVPRPHRTHRPASSAIAPGLPHEPHGVASGPSAAGSLPPRGPVDHPEQVPAGHVGGPRSLLSTPTENAHPRTSRQLTGRPPVIAGDALRGAVRRDHHIERERIAVTEKCMGMIGENVKVWSSISS